MIRTRIYLDKRNHFQEFYRAKFSIFATFVKHGPRELSTLVSSILVDQIRPAFQVKAHGTQTLEKGHFAMRHSSQEATLKRHSSQETLAPYLLASRVFEAGLLQVYLGDMSLGTLDSFSGKGHAALKHPRGNTLP